MVNEQKPSAELNNNNNNKDNNNNNDNINREECKVQLRMQNSCTSTESFEETRTIDTKVN